jgi:hypothetical protein
MAGEAMQSGSWELNGSFGSNQTTRGVLIGWFLWPFFDIWAVAIGCWSSVMVEEQAVMVEFGFSRFL